MVTQIILQSVPPGYYYIPYLHYFISLSQVRNWFVGIAGLIFLAVCIYGCYKSGWLSYQNVWAFLKFLFPPGNYRYYVAYFSFVIVAGTLLFILPLVMILLIQGISISTNTFVATLTSREMNMVNDTLLFGVLSNLLGMAGVGVLILFIHTCFSFMLDIGTITWKIIGYIRLNIGSFD